MTRERLSMSKISRVLKVDLHRPRSVYGSIGSEARDALPFLDRVCTSKLAFATRAKAVKWLRAHPPGENMSACVPYRCPHCDSWHTTKKRRP